MDMRGAGTLNVLLYRGIQSVNRTSLADRDPLHLGRSRGLRKDGPQVVAVRG
jgi:hypothetical protein